MNYERIYAEFIADRRLKEQAIIGYAENHHIVPRSRGGSDDTSNLIALTLEDHIRAHILLGRIYKGQMWFALRKMIGQYAKRGILPTRRERNLAAMGLAKAREFSRSDEGRRLNSERIKTAWENPEAKQRHLDAMAKTETRKALSKHAVSRYAVPENRVALGDAVRKGCNTPEYLDGLSKRSSALMADQAMRERIKASNVAAYSDPKLRAKIGAAISAANKDPESRARRARATKAVSTNPEVAAKKRAAMLALLQNKKDFCLAHGIADAGKGYSNIDKSALAQWIAQNA